MPVRSVLRPLRAAAFAAVCLALSATGHALASGGSVGPLALASGFWVVFGVAVLVDHDELSQFSITAGMLTGQIGLHELFSHTQPMEHHVPAAVDGVTMVLAHLFAGLLAGWWLRRGEASCWRLVRSVETVAGALRRLTVLTSALVAGMGDPALPGAAAQQVVLERGPRPASTLMHSLVRRGPPRIV